MAFQDDGEAVGPGDGRRPAGPRSYAEFDAGRLRRELVERDRAQELAGVGSWTVDLTTGVCTWSDQLHRIFGTDPATLDTEPETYLDYVHPEDRGALEAQNAVLFDSPDGLEVDYRIRRPDGRVRTVLGRVRVDRDEGGTPTRLGGICMDVTEQRHSENERDAAATRLEAATLELVEQRQFLQDAQQLAGVGSWSADLATGRGRWSQEMHRIHGRSADAPAPDLESFMAMVHPQDRGAMTESVGRALETGQAQETEYRVQRPDGELRLLLGRTRADRGPDGEPVRLSGITMDVTDDRRLERERAEATAALLAANREIASRESQLEEAQSLAGVGSFVFEPQAGMLQWSPEMFRIFGADRIEDFELTLERYQALIHPDDIGRLDAVVWQAVASAQPYEVEHRLLLPWGEERVLQARGRPEFDAQGELLRLSGTGMDVTEARRTERELIGARDLFQQLLSAATDQAIIGIDTRGDITLFNKGAEDLLGYTREEMLGRKPWTLLRTQEELAEMAGHMDVDEVYLAAFRGEATPGTPPSPAGRARMPGADRDRPWRRKDGSVVTIQMTINPMRDADGEVSGYLAVATDVTEQRRAERERDEHAETLRGALQEISQARDEALAANAAKSAFLATMSHEIRTPMNAVIGMTGLLLDTDLSPDQQDLLEVVRSSGDQLLTLINDILDFSKVEAGELDLEFRPFGLRDLVEGTMALFATSDHGLDLVTDLAPDCPDVVVGDVTRLRQVLVNLVGNAIKFTAEGDVLLRVTSVGQGRLQFQVADTGIGIPAESMHRLFKSFSQVDASTTRTYGGTGLGLAISRALIQAMGGEIWVDSVAGEGSTFSFVVTLSPAAGEASGEGPTRFPGRRVLLVDDNATSRTVLGAQLSEQGLDVHALADPRAALELLRDATEQFDAAVLDLRMPGLDGVQLATAIRALPGRETLPLILLSTIGRRLEQDEALFAAAVTKPVRRAALGEGLTRALSPATAVPAQVRSTVAKAAAGRPLTILLAEDNAVNQKVGLLMLGKLGHTVEVAANGAEALAAAHARDHDVVLMDMHMPVMDGLEATRRIRAELAPERQPRIVAMTASVTLEDREACIAAGMDGYLPKPVRAAELAAALAEVPLPA